MIFSKHIGRFILLLLSFCFIALFIGGRNTAVSANVPFTPNTPNAPTLNFTSFATGFNLPTDIANAGDYRLFIVEKPGTIKVVQSDGAVSGTPFLDITSDVDSTKNEEGLLGLVFHPDYPNTPYFYVNYTHATDGTRISRFQVSSDPDVADPNSELILLTIAQPGPNHNGGDLNFGTDGYLYIGMGDGGGEGDPSNRAQDLTKLWGKMLRIDVDPSGGAAPDCGSGANYSIPTDNPFVDGAGNNCDEIWAYGLRNPWRFSFDRETGDLFIGDVGQDDWEEIDHQPASSSGGENYGWRLKEGNQCFNPPSNCDPGGLTDPIFDYSHSDGHSITGGYIYRGSQYPALAGYYIFADYVTENVWIMTQNGNSWTTQLLGDTFGLGNPSTFGERCDGELYVADYSGGAIYHIEETGSGGGTFFIYLPFITGGTGTGTVCN